MPEPWEEILRIADRFEPAMRREFLRAFNTVRATVDINLLADAVRLGDVARIMELLELDPASQSFSVIRRLFADAFERAGLAAIRRPPGGLVLTFDMQNPLIPNIINRHIGARIVEILALERGSTLVPDRVRLDSRAERLW